MMKITEMMNFIALIDRKKVFQAASHPVIWILCAGMFVLFYHVSLSKEEEGTSTLPIMPVKQESLHHRDTLISPDYISAMLAETQPISAKSPFKEEYPEERNLKKTPPAGKQTAIREEYSMQNAQTVKASAVSAGGEINVSTTVSIKAEETLRNTDPWSYYKAPSYTAVKKPKVLKIAITDTLKVQLLTPISTLNYGESAIVSVLESLKGFPELKGAKLIGKFYALQHSNRIYIRFSELVLENGKSHRISAVAKSFDKKTGISADVDQNIGNDILKVLTKTFIGSTDRESIGGAVLEKATGKSIQNLETDRVLSTPSGRRFVAFFDQALFTGLFKPTESIAYHGFSWDRQEKRRLL